MLFWFVGTAVVAVWFVFRDPAFDYRLLIVGSLLHGVGSIQAYASQPTTLVWALSATLASRPANACTS